MKVCKKQLKIGQGIYNIKKFETQQKIHTINEFETSWSVLDEVSTIVLDC